MDSDATLPRYMLDGLLAHLLVGLKQYEDRRVHGNIGYPYPISLQHALNRLAALLPLSGKVYPVTFDDVLQMFEKPLINWWPDTTFDSLPGDGFKYLAVMHRGALCGDVLDYLADANLTDLIDASARKLQEELDQGPIKRMVELAQNDPNKYAADYVKARSFIVRYPQTTERELDTIQSDLSLTFGDLLASVYETESDFKLQANHGNAYWRCPYCSGILNWIDGQPRCVRHDICSTLSNGYQLREQISVKSRERLLRLKRSMHARTCIPGIPEVSLYDTLEDLHQKHRSKIVEVSLWPGGDRYDLRISFANHGREEVWAIDVKDYDNPYQMARKLKDDHGKQIAIRGHERLGWQHFFYVVPDYRAEWNSRYTYQVQDDFKDAPIYRVSEFVSAITDKIGEEA